MGRNLDYEEYLLGTSDNPRAPEVRIYTARPRLEFLLDYIDIRILNPNRSLNVEATNSCRLERVKSKHLNPVIRFRKTPYYRHVTRDRDSVIGLEYKPAMPINFENLFPDETISYDVAAEYLDISKKQLIELIRAGEIKTLKNGVLLADANRYKRELKKLKIS